MRIGVLFSGGKDSCYAAFLSQKQGHEIVCLISIISKNPHSYMFHTPNIKFVKKQAEAMKLPILIQRTAGIKEMELLDLEKAIKRAMKKYKIEAIVTGAIASMYQTSRIKSICDKLKLKCLNPLWQKNQFEMLQDIIGEGFGVLITGTFALGLEDFVGRKINQEFIRDIKKIHEKYKINVAGEGGEFESFVLDCPLFKRKIEIERSQIKKDKDNCSILIIDKIRFINKKHYK